ncbi:chromosome replication/partitioning protein (plasmid) [Borreliella turdi]|uniref:chromosome replication/partitioning protein n=1 Tax=Borreliella turdi TaxID=57863 RepID=UPI003AEFAD39
MNKKEPLLNSRIKTKNSLNKELISSLSSLNNNQDKNLTIYNELKEQLKLNLQDDINNKIQRMKILYEIKEKKLYKYDGFKSFEQFIKSFLIAKTQAYMYLKVYEKVLKGDVSIDKIKEIGFTSVYQYLQKNDLYDMSQKYVNKNNNENIPIRILIKNKDLYNFCKEDTKRVSFILEELFENKKNILLEFISKYEKIKKEKNK